MIYTGVVESRMDPLKLGRCQARVHGLHTHDKNLLPTSDLPWAYVMSSTESAAISGIGVAPVGPVEGTVVMIVFMDREEQQPIIIGTLGGIPQSEGAVDNDQPPLLLDGSEVPVTTNQGSAVTPSAPAKAATSPTTAPTPQVPGQAPFNTREGSNVKIRSTCTNGILAVGKAMDQLGITGSYARAAILGIIGGECEWIPQSEGYKYSRSRIQEVFSWMSDADADKYANWKGSREDFFRFVYGPTTRSGKNLGNKEADDGAKYYGRGYVQLTGAANYKRYAQLSGVDIVNNPELMNDSTQGALISVSYFKDRVKVAQNDPGYFDAACAAVGYNVPNIKAKKQAYYQYFLLGDQQIASTTVEPVATNAEIGSQPSDVKTSSAGFPIDRQASLVLGFRDPNMKYPLREFLNEPDTNRLARGRTEGTSVQVRDNTRMVDIPTADGSTWSQPPVPYNARYPFNRMRQSESGHLFEMDDTPDNERVNLQHRTGTFVEMDVNGTQVNRIVGDGYEIIDRNGYVYVKGAYNITSEGFTTIYVNADAHVRVAGHTQFDLEQDLDMNVARDFNLNIGGNWNVQVGGYHHLTIGGEEQINVGESQTVIVADDQTINVLGGRNDKVADDVTVDIGGNLSLKIGGNSNEQISGNATIKTGGTWQLSATSIMRQAAGVDATIATGAIQLMGASIAIGTSGSGATSIASNGGFKITTTGNFSVDATNIELQQGTSGAVSPSINPPAIADAKTVSSSDTLNRASPPSFGNPKNNTFANLTTPPRNFEEETSYETPEEIATPEGVAFHKERDSIIVGEKSDPAKVNAEETVAAPRNTATSTGQNCDLIMQMNDFPLSLKLSNSFTLGNLICDPKHILADQMLMDSRSSPPRKYTKQEIVCNLKGLAENILEPLIQLVPGGRSAIAITSGYRYAGLTANESKVSDHPKGNAVDIVLAGKSFDYQAHYELAQLLAANLPYHQIILEYRDAGRPGNSRGKRIVWIHISHRYTGSQKMAFTMLNDKTYGQGFTLLEA